MNTLMFLMQGLAFIFLLFLSMFFSGSETALTSLSKPWIKTQLERNPKKAKHLKAWLERPNRLLTAILVGNNFVNICASALATSIAIGYARYIGWRQSYVLGITVGLVTFVILVFGEIIPKTFAKQNARRISLILIGYVLIISKFFSPIIKMLLAISNIFIRIFGGKKVIDVPFLTEEEIRTLIDLGAREGVLEKEEGRMIHDVLEFGETVVREVMVPRVEMDCIDENKDIDRIVEDLIKMGHSRVPVYRGNLDNIVGILYAKDVLKVLPYKRQEGIKLQDLIREPYFVPESKMVSVLLKEFRRGKMHIAIVVDEYGTVSGLVTLEDLVEEITGEILDEYDVEEKTIEKYPDGSYMVYAREDIDKINEELNLKLPASKFDSLGGLIIDLFGRVPRQGEEIDYKDVKFIVESSTKQKVVKVKIKSLVNINKGSGEK